MPRYILRATQIDEIRSRGGRESEIWTIGSKSPERLIDAISMRDLQDQFNAFASSLEPRAFCYRIRALKDTADGAPKFPGFDRAAARGGPLNRIVNPHVAVAAARARQQSGTAAAGARGGN